MSKRILFVDDRPIILDMVKEVLEDDGYEVLLRQTPFQSVAEIEALHPDLILLTVPNVVDSVARRTLHMLKHHSIPILVGVPEPKYLLKQDREWMSEHMVFLLRPFYMDDLIDAVHQVIGA